MDKNQEITFQLLKEIDEICNENQITYYLHADTAAMALKNDGKYFENYISTAIEMTTQEARKFIKAVETRPKEKRALEHMGNYSGYAGFTMRYVNTDTLYVPLNYFDNYEQKGIGIQIIFIRGKIKNKWKQKFWTLIELGMEQNEFFVSRRLNKKELLGKYFVKILQIFWKKASMKKYFFNKWLYAYDDSGEETVFLRKMYGKKREYPRRYFDATKKIDFEGYKFPVIWDTVAQIRRWQGNNWYNNFKGVKPRRELLIDGQISYAEFIEYLKGEGICFDKIKSKHRVLKKMVLQRSELSKKKKMYWKCAWNVRKNYISDEKYKNIKQLLYRLYENKAYVELDEALQYYSNVMKENIKFDYRREGDADIHKIYKEMLEVKGEKDMLNKLAKWEK